MFFDIYNVPNRKTNNVVIRPLMQPCFAFGRQGSSFENAWKSEKYTLKNSRRRLDLNQEFRACCQLHKI
jgi:hypothetical protein